MAKKRSVIWEFFVVTEDMKYAVCNTCQAKVSRGGGSTRRKFRGEEVAQGESFKGRR